MSAADATEALAIASTQRVDLVLCDYRMPGINGIDLCRLYRDKGGVLPVLMLTGRHGSTEATQCKEAGANKYLPKPFQLEELTRELEALL